MNALAEMAQQKDPNEAVQKGQPYGEKQQSLVVLTSLNEVVQSTQIIAEKKFVKVINSEIKVIATPVATIRQGASQIISEEKFHNTVL